MKGLALASLTLALLALPSGQLVPPVQQKTRPAPSPVVGPVTVRDASAFDLSAPLDELLRQAAPEAAADEPSASGCQVEEHGCGLSPEEREEEREGAEARRVPAGSVPPQAAPVEQTAMGERPAAVLLASFDGHGFGMVGPQGQGGGGNPSDNSMAVGRNHIVETVNSRVAVYTKKGELFETTGEILFGPIGNNVVFTGFGGECEARPNGDTVVRYDQLADRWLFVMPLFRRAAVVPPGRSEAPYGMCYALSAGPNPMGPYYRYYFERDLFPDYPRPAIWPDGYYVPTSTGDNLLPDGTLPEKHACVVERSKMLEGLPAREQCVFIKGLNFLNNADIDGQGLPPAGAPNIMMATGGTQLREDYEDDGIYVWKFHVDWENPDRTSLDGPTKIDVAPYHYLCNGQLTNCVPQPGTDRGLDSQGDKIMQRLVYRNVDGHESIVAVHSVATAAGGGGVRWYEFRVGDDRMPYLYQQGTYAPDGFYRWMASPSMDRKGNIGIGYSFGGTPNFAGQRFSGRLADDPLGKLTFGETILIEGGASQTNTLRWEDYTQTSMDPVDDCTFWYVGDYLKEGAPSYTTRIGAFRFPGCLSGTVSGTTFYDVDHDGMRQPNEPALPGRPVEYAGLGGAPGRAQPPSGTLQTGEDGTFELSLPADPAYFEPLYAFSSPEAGPGAWSRTGGGAAYASGGAIQAAGGRYTVRLEDRDYVARVDFGSVCIAQSAGGQPLTYWAGPEGRSALQGTDQVLPEDTGRGRGRGGRGRGRGGDAGWRATVNLSVNLVSADGARFTVPGQGSFDEAYGTLADWLRAAEGSNLAHRVSAQLAVAALNLAQGGQGGDDTVQDPVEGDWPTVSALVPRVSGFLADNPSATQTSGPGRALVAYESLLRSLNANAATVTPSTPDRCPSPS